MCGIIGYTGRKNAADIVTEGLARLEYRGYDSVGLAAQTETGTHTVRCRGRVDALRKKLEEAPPDDSRCAIGHTRWATHGSPSDENAHPHRAGRVVLVHNGIIENYRELKEELLRHGIQLTSETDTEIAAAVVDACYRENISPETALRHALRKLCGSYAFGILFDDVPDVIFAVRSGSPLILAKGADGCYLASDMTALLPFTREYCPMEENDIARLTPDGVTLFREDGSIAEPVWHMTDLTPESAQKGGYDHFMLKEICEQPDALRHTLCGRIRNGLADFSDDGMNAAFWRRIGQIRIAACGSAMHAGLAGAHLIESLAGVPAYAHIASEYRYHPPAVLPLEGKECLVIVVSQSGETADTIAALRYAKASGMPTLAIVNAAQSIIAWEADYRICTHAGPEIAVATTKGYCTQAAVLWLIASALAHAGGKISDENARQIVRSLQEDAPQAVSTMIERRSELQKIAGHLAPYRHIFYIGRGMDYALAQEGALKLKEISYIHAEAYAAGELKHGTISLIEQGTPVIALTTKPALADKMENGICEVQSRGAYVVHFCRLDCRQAYRSEPAADETITLPVSGCTVGGTDAASLFAALTAMQILAYETARIRGCDIDRPRNLAKSVTVE